MAPAPSRKRPRAEDEDGEVDLKEEDKELATFDLDLDKCEGMLIIESTASVPRESQANNNLSYKNIAPGDSYKRMALEDKSGTVWMNKRCEPVDAVELRALNRINKAHPRYNMRSRRTKGPSSHLGSCTLPPSLTLSSR